MKLLASLAASALLSLLCLTSVAQSGSPAPINGYRPAWWKEGVVYQVYPRSFKDSNGDGIGDLNGITSKLDYLQTLGVNVIWLSPHFDSPNADNGYDIRDYRKVMTEFGTMGDFDRMLAGIKQRHMRLIIDLVVNHTSDEHRWFTQSASSKTNPYRDYYIWRDGKPNASAPHGFDPPNNYPSFFSGSAWEWSEPTRQFYLHLFAVKQPDLNWENPKVRQEVYGLMRFWLDKGVDGFRMDVIPLISKQPGLPDLTAEQLKTGEFVALWANGPKRDEYLREMNREVLSKYDDMSVGEAIGITLAETPLIVGTDRHELSEIFNFDAIRIGRDDRRMYGTRAWKLPELKAIYDRHAALLPTDSWDTVFLSNHDNSRVVSTFGDDSAEFRASSAKMIATLLMTLRGTPYIYQGDELGMTNYAWTKISQFNDIEVQNAYKAQVLTGRLTEQELIAGASKVGRDNARTPMQWNGNAEAGFTTGTHPWEPVNPNYKTINADAEIKDPASIYHYTQQAIALHHKSKAFTYGDYKDLDPLNDKVFAYSRTLGEEKFVVVLNWSKTATTYELPGKMDLGKLVLANGVVKDTTSTLHLGAYEARVYKY